MTTINPTLTTTPTTTVRIERRNRPVLVAGALSGVVAAAATTTVALAAVVANVPMKAAPRTEEVGRAIPLSGFAVSTLMCTAVGTLLALALLRWSKRPAATFVGVTTALTVLSFAGPVTTGHATTATRLVLALTHVVAAAVVIPALATRLRSR